jgi:hypothetical protein
LVKPASEQQVPVDEWKFLRPDNELVRTLKKLAMGMARAVQLDARKTEKTLKGAKKVYYGR